MLAAMRLYRECVSLHLFLRSLGLVIQIYADSALLFHGLQSTFQRIIDNNILIKIGN